MKRLSRYPTIPQIPSGLNNKLEPKGSPKNDTIGYLSVTLFKTVDLMYLGDEMPSTTIEITIQRLFKKLENAHLGKGCRENDRAAEPRRGCAGKILKL